MTRILLIAVGSRGDAEPFCSLAASLAAAGTHVDCFLQPDVMHLAPHDPQISCHALPFTQMDFYKFTASPKHGADHPDPRVRFVGIVADVVAELVLPCHQQVLEVAESKSVNSIVASSLARQLAMMIAEALQLPLYLVQLQPLVPTRDFPHSSQTDACVSALTSARNEPSEENFTSYKRLERFQYDFVKQRHVTLAASSGSSSIPDFDDVFSALTGYSDKEIWMVNAVSNHLIPNCTDAGEKILNVGALADTYVPGDWTPPEDLVSFLDSLDQPPVCIGYGSMPFEKVNVLVNASERANRPAILVGTSMDAIDKTAWTKSNIFCIPSVPYAWLLPRCAMMCSHGGAGVVHATLRAGIPAVISPLMGDQFFWAKLLEAKGLGVQTSNNLMSLSEEDLVDAIHKADHCKSACKEIALSMSSEASGAEAFSKILNSYC